MEQAAVFLMHRVALAESGADPAPVRVRARTGADPTHRRNHTTEVQATLHLTRTGPKCSSTDKEAPEMILITTAGKVGAEAARILAERDQPVRVLVRHAEKASGLARLGVDIAQGDLTQPATVDAALNGVSAVILVSPAVPAEEMNVIRGAVRTGAQHIVKITSKSSLDSPIPRRRDQAEIENGLIGSGLGYTLLKNNAYMQNFLVLAPQIVNTNGFGSAAGDGKIGMVDTRDVAAAAANIAAAPESHAEKTYWLTGPQRLSYRDAASTLTRVLGRPITYTPLTFDEQKQAMVKAGLPELLAAMNAKALELFAQGDSDWITDDVQTVIGKPPRSFQRFVTDNAQAFGATIRPSL